MINKLIVGIVAQNNAGKTNVAKVSAHNLGALYYSAREKIRQRYKRLNGKDIQSVDTEFQSFCQTQKQEFGGHVFLEECVNDFLEVKGINVCVIESFRATGEANWLLNEMPQKYPNITGALIAVTAPYEERLGRFLAGRSDELSERTKEGFDFREQLVNKGTEHWSENVEEVIRLASRVFNNPNGMLTKTIQNVTEYVDAFAEKHIQNYSGGLFKFH